MTLGGVTITMVAARARPPPSMAGSPEKLLWAVWVTAVEAAH